MLKTMTLLALVMLTSAAPADGNRQLATEKDKRELGWWWSYLNSCKHGRRIEAKVQQGAFEITVVGKESLLDIAGGVKTRGVTWDIIKEHGSQDIPGYGGLTNDDPANPHKRFPYNYHIHAKPINGYGSTAEERCGGAVTSGHTDSGHACGGASEFKGSICPKIWGPDFKDTYNDRCGKCTEDGVLGNTCNGCEYGDLSGKLPKIPAMASFEDYSAMDTHIEPITTYKTMSIVVHGCTAAGCSPRVACGDIEYHPY
jgi:hypothetical protein